MTGLRTPLSNCPRWSALDGMWCSMHARRPCEACQDPSWVHGPSCSSQPCLTAPCTLPGTLFGPSNKPVLDPSGTICPFADAAGGWLPLLCTLNCTGVTEEVCMCGPDGDSMGVMLHLISWCPLGQLVTTRDGLLHAAEVPAACRRQPMPSQG